MRPPPPHLNEHNEYKYEVVEKAAKFFTSIRLASHFARVPNSWSGGHEFESPAWIELGALTEDGKTLGIRYFHSGDPNMIMSCLHVAHCLSVCCVMLAACGMSLAGSLKRAVARRHGRWYFSAKPSPCDCAVPTTKAVLERALVEKPADTQTSIWLARHLVTAPNPHNEDMSSNYLRE